MKKMLSLLVLLGLGASAGLTSCGPSNNTDAKTQSAQSLKLQTVGAFNMLKEMEQSGSSGAKSLQRGRLLRDSDDKPITDESKEQIKQILPNLELMLDSESQPTIDSKVETISITNPETGSTYNTKETFTVEGTTYTLIYFDKVNDSGNSGNTGDTGNNTGSTSTSTSTSTSSSGTSTVQPEIKQRDDDRWDDKWDDFDDDWNTEKKTISRIEGLAFTDPKALEGETIDFSQGNRFVSKVETESDRNESETERSFKIYSDPSSYVEVNEEFEIEGKNEEHQYQYTVVDNGMKTLEYSISIDTKNKNAVEYEINQQEYELVRRTENGKVYLYVDYENDMTEEEGWIKFEKTLDETGNIVYVEVK